MRSDVAGRILEHHALEDVPDEKRYSFTGGVYPLQGVQATRILWFFFAYRTAAGGCCCCLILGARPLSISDNRVPQHVVCRLCPSLCTDSESAIPFSKSSIIVAACPVYGCNVLKHNWDQHFRPPGMPFLRIAPTLQAT